MSDKEFKPFVPAESDMKEFTFRAVFLGVLMAIVLGAANAYLGMKAGMTVSATFPGRGGSDGGYAGRSAARS